MSLCGRRPESLLRETRFESMHLASVLFVSASPLNETHVNGRVLEKVYAADVDGNSSASFNH